MMTTEECIAHGGHCWQQAGMGMVRGDGQESHSERCKHCPATRTAIRRSPWEYIDTTPKAQP